ncbi:hypothetical protein [Cellvibrio sp. UBA7671]|uniref:hypothetical protein n=1 Tax=Cellvibrio sp. UBA7671 TaxID=1946312 RepID=UPI002F36069F
MLVKFCEHKYNPLGACKTIRLGTIEYYRTLNPSFTIADPHEGVDSYDVDYFSEVPNEECKKFLANGYFNLGDAKRVTMVGVKIKRTHPNCYIWCCKKIEGQLKKGDGRSIDVKYSSHYIIKSPEEFANHAKKMLHQNLSIDSFDESSQHYISGNSLSITDLELHCYYDEIRYVPQKMGAFFGEHSFHYNQDIPDFIRHVFTKPEKHKHESEFRFLFSIFCPINKRLLTVKKDPINLQWIPNSAIGL